MFAVLPRRRKGVLIRSLGEAQSVLFAAGSGRSRGPYRIRGFPVPFDGLTILPPPCIMRLVNDEDCHNGVDDTDSRKFERPFIRIASSWRHQQIGYGVNMSSA